MNQGAWYASQHNMRRVIQRHKVIYLRYAGREPQPGGRGLHGSAPKQRKHLLMKPWGRCLRNLAVLR